MVREHEHRMVERRILAPPARPRPRGVPWPGMAAEHVPAHDGGADVLERFLHDGTARVDVSAFAAVLRAPLRQRNCPLVQLLAADPERLLHALVGAGDEAVE